jgi:hypothetical protein
MPSELSYCPPELIAQPLLPCTSPPQTPPLPPSSFALIPVSSSVVPGLHDAIQEGERSINMEDPNAAHGDSKVRDVRVVRGGAPFVEASKFPRHEVGLVTCTL